MSDVPLTETESPTYDVMLADAFKRQRDRSVASSYVNRSGWTDDDWIADAERLMNEPDGAITSLVNGHVLRLLKQNRAQRAELVRVREENVALREDLTRAIELFHRALLVLDGDARGTTAQLRVHVRSFLASVGGKSDG